MNYIERARAFYEQELAPAIREQFGQYESRIAAGLVGEGSECFGFDDEYSEDHDLEPGCCLWLTDKDDEEIGQALHELYEQFAVPSARRGVFRIDKFYSDLLGTKNWKKKDTWGMILEHRLATAVNGVVFRDDSGGVTRKREFIGSYYPQQLWRIRLAEQLHLFSQNGQYNYARMMARKDDVTASICVAQAVKGTMGAAYLLNKIYCPYYKWMRRGMEQFTVLKELPSLIDELAVMGNQSDAWKTDVYSSAIINRTDQKVELFEQIAETLLTELNRQGIVQGKDPFLDRYCQEIMRGGEMHG